MNRITLLSAVLGTAVMTAGCGLKGDLYMPEKEQSQMQSTTVSPGPADSGSTAAHESSGEDAADGADGAAAHRAP